MIDTHCHLTDPRLESRLLAVLLQAEKAAVSQMITIGTGVEDAQDAIALCSGFPNIRCAVGIHPNYSAEADLSQIEQLRQLQNDSNVVAIGEMGLDYHYDRAPRDHQRRIFEAQVQLAADVHKPIVIHCREAVDDTLSVLGNSPGVPAVFHCFTGKLTEARRIIDAGYLIGFTGPITYKKNDELREVVRFVPIERMLVETDAPYLTPEPMRKAEYNQPAFVMHTAAKAAEIKGLTIKEFDRITTATAHRFFRLGGMDF
jgi:TatD DNase family protein